MDNFFEGNSCNKGANLPHTDTVESFQDALRSLGNGDLYGASMGLSKRRIISNLDDPKCSRTQFESLLDKVNSQLASQNFSSLPQNASTQLILETLNQVLSQTEMNSDKLEQNFTKLMGREAMHSNPSDLNILKVISAYERKLKTTDNRPNENEEFERRTIRELCSILSIKNPKHIVSAVQKLEKVTRALPQLEKFIRDVCFFVSPHRESRIEEVLPALERHYQALEDLRNFKKDIQEALDLDESFTPDDVLEILNADTADTDTVEHFCRLFEVDREAANDKIDQVFLLVHELKSFLKQARTSLKMPEETPVSSVLLHIKKFMKLS